MRAGAHLLLMAADPIKRGILQKMLERPLKMGHGREYRVTSGGREALFVGFVVERWLQSAPQGPIPYDSRDGGRAVTALAEGWSATVVHALAREPLTLSELHEAVEGLGRRALKQHLAAMQSAGQVEALADDNGGAIYAITDWLRAGIAPLIASARIERRNPQEGMVPIDDLDVEAGFRLSLPLIELPKELSGTCRLGLNLDEEENLPMTGVTARIDQGRVVSCTPGLGEKADAWAAASAADWLDTVIEPDAKRVRTGGDRWLARAVLDRLHRTLFGVPVAKRP
jgi:DNA-binding HxlR family transcriptional regulator